MSMNRSCNASITRCHVSLRLGALVCALAFGACASEAEAPRGERANAGAGSSTEATGYRRQDLVEGRALQRHNQLDLEWLNDPRRMARLQGTVWSPEPVAKEPRAMNEDLFELPPDPGTEGSDIEDAVVEGDIAPEPPGEQAAEKAEQGPASPTTPPTSDYDYFSLEDCRARTTGELKNRYAYCFWKEAVTNQYVCPQEGPMGPEQCVWIGSESFRLTMLGRGRRDRQEMTFEVTLDAWNLVGVVDETALFAMNIECTTKGANYCEPGGPYERIVSLAQWKANPTFAVTFNTTRSAGGGDGQHFDIDKVSFHAMQSRFERVGMDTMQNRMIQIDKQGFRCDAAPYLLTARAGACLFDEWRSVLRYDASPGSGVTEVAQHIKFAQANPTQVTPKWPAGSYIPGTLDPLRPLRRLYADARYQDTTLTDGDLDGAKYYGRQIRRKDKACTPLRKAPGAAGKQCDEFPFATTYEGAYYPSKHPESQSKFSVRMINADDNQKAGTDLGLWYGSEHIIAMDKFFVQIDN